MKIRWENQQPSYFLDTDERAIIILALRAAPSSVAECFSEKLPALLTTFEQIDRVIISMAQLEQEKP
jgi:hypothetical protein